ncbi:MAG: helicase-related protein [Luteolibacter sp.]
MQPGQRWVSDNEPELGLGIVIAVDGDLVDLHFPGSDETRRYAIHTAPLRRVRFAPGDRVRDDENREHLVSETREQSDQIIYQTDRGILHEEHLCGTMTFSKPQDRLLALSLDDARSHALRGEALEWRARIGAAMARGFAGARMELLPHQLYIAEEICSRQKPRVLLADEVGLGKTIEACLIIHRLMLTGRADRVLILVPEPLCHQWFVELLRRFNLTFALFDEDRCASITEHEPEANPFFENQWILAAIDWLAENPQRAKQATDAGWDLLVIDEAHHLSATTDAMEDEAARKMPEPPWQAHPARCKSWQLAESLAAATPGLLLLTATPLHDGLEAHFQRLTLLDPDRYPSFTSFTADQLDHEKLADLLDAIESASATSAMLTPWLEKHPAIQPLAEAWENDPSPENQAALVSRLLDGFGLGRVMFRNTRARLGGFPRRVANIATLTPAADSEEEWGHKASWITALHDNGEADEKILVICHERKRAEWLAEHLTNLGGIPCALFHEGLTLLQRDRNAAYFAEPQGARVLICSETGSEGRNFQFARHLVLADLPPDLELLEQRIGRLDRIGRSHDVLVHIPVCRDSAQEIRARWIHGGLDGFTQTIPGANEIQAKLGHALAAACDPPNPAGLEKLLPTTRVLRNQITARLARGEERLLARQSHHPGRGAAMVNAVQKWDDDGSFQSFTIRLFEHLGLHVEELGSGRWFLRPESLRAEGFPEIPEDGITVTFSRRRALERENEGFMTIDHPILRAALDILLGSEQGNTHFAWWPSKGEKRLLLECRFIAETIAPAALHHERYLPQTPLTVLVDHHAKSPEDGDALRRASLKPAPPTPLRQPVVRTKVFPAMLAAARTHAESRLREIIASATTRMTMDTYAELTRLHELAAVNPHVTPEEIAQHETHQAHLREALAAATVRLDSLRLIWQAPV